MDNQKSGYVLSKNQIFQRHFFFKPRKPIHTTNVGNCPYNLNLMKIKVTCIQPVECLKGTAMATNSINRDYLGKYNPVHPWIVENHKIQTPSQLRQKVLALYNSFLSTYRKTALRSNGWRIYCKRDSQRVGALWVTKLCQFILDNKFIEDRHYY